MPMWIYNLPHWQLLILFAEVAVCACWGLMILLTQPSE
jgi:hypothetical protein